MTLERDQIFDLLDVGDMYSSHLGLTNDPVAASILTLSQVVYQIHRQNKEPKQEGEA